MNKNLTTSQKDYALFLPATSGFYSSFVGYQRKRFPYVEPARIPQNFTNGVEGLNFLDPKSPLFHYKWALYSAGHANLDLNKQDDREEMFRTRPRNGDSWVLGDSGGFQIGKGKWPGDWKDPNCPAAMKKRKQVLNWMDTLMDYGMCLDIPAWVARSPEGQKATGISTYEEACKATEINNDYFVQNRNGNCKFLNVLQGENHADADDWYERMKKYCDPTIYPDNHFNGWGMGGQNMCDVHLVLKRLVALRFDGLLEKGVQDWMHFLGTSKLEWACLLTDIQRSVRKHHNSNFTISFDCASPFLATANGQVYVQNEMEDRQKWLYRMLPTLDNKSYSKDTRLFRDALIQDGVYKNFTNSPVIEGVKTNEICIYAPGDLNKVGNEGKTSWDSFSYAILMGHNVWMHLSAVQEANRKYDEGSIPKMLVDERFNTLYSRDVIDAIFATSSRDEANRLIEEHSKFWMAIPGTRGAIGKKTQNASTYFGNFFDVKESTPVEDEDGLDETKLETLEVTA
jgi:hypothetical protein|tara:strand:- start:1083 stop:2618 length:1536 start_codon:yes stop_codon:yes gene_type:complete